MAFPKMLVKVNGRIAEYGGVLYDYLQDKNIGSEPVEVEPTNLVMKWIANGEVEVVEKPPQPANSETESFTDGKWPIALRLDVVDIFEKLGMSPEDVKAMTDEELLSIRGIGNKTLKHIREVMG